MINNLRFYLISMPLLLFLWSCNTPKDKAAPIHNPTPPPDLPKSTISTSNDTTVIAYQLQNFQHQILSPLYTVSLQFSDLNCQVQLNGISLFKSLHGRPNTADITSVNPWIMPGQNTLEIIIDSLPFQTYNSEKQAICSFWPSSNTQMDSLKLWEIIFQEDNSQQALPIKYVLNFSTKQLPASSFWQQAETIILDKATKQEANQLIEMLHTAISEKQIDSFCNIMDFQISEMQKVFYYGEEFKENWRAGVENRLQSIRVFRLDPHEYTYRLLANEKVLEVLAQGQSPVRSPDGQSRIPILIGKIGGQLQIVR